MGRWRWAMNQRSQPQLIPREAMEPKWPVRVVLREAEVARPLYSCLNHLLDIDNRQRDVAWWLSAAEAIPARTDS